MNKTAIKNFSIWARNKLISDIQFRAQLLGVLPDRICEPLPQSDSQTQFFDIGTKDYVTVKGGDVSRRAAFVEALRAKAARTDYATAYKAIIEKVAYTWFNRLIAIRFMEVNDYLPGRVRVLSSTLEGKAEPDLVSNPFEGGLTFTEQEQDTILRFKDENRLDELFRMLFIMECQSLSAILPGLFVKKEESLQPRDYHALLLNVNFTDRDGLVWHLTHDIPERDFRVRTREDDLRQAAEGIPEEEMPAGQVEIIGWLYQYYNTEPKNEVFAGLKKNKKIGADDIPAATQLFTPDWIVKYMVENSLGRIFVSQQSTVNRQQSEEARQAEEKVIADRMGWRYYLPEAPQTPEVREQLSSVVCGLTSAAAPQALRVIDPCCGSGHIAVYLFDVLMQIYETQGWTQREAAQSIVAHNLYALDIDDRAAQLAYFAVMMKARQYDRRFFTRGLQPHVYAIPEWDGPQSLPLEGKVAPKGSDEVWSAELKNLCNLLRDGKEFGSIIDVPEMDWNALRMEVERMADMQGQISIDSVSEETRQKLRGLIDVGQAMARKYDVVVTNPPYMGASNMGQRLNQYIKDNYPDYKSDFFSAFMVRCSAMTKPEGYCGFFTPYVWMFIQSYEKLRKYLYEKCTIETLIQFEYSAFAEATVPVCTLAFKNSHISGKKGCYFRLTEFRGGMEVQRQKTLKAIANHDCGFYFEQTTDSFAKIPGAPIAYWVSDAFIQAYQSPQLYDCSRPCKGIDTGDNNIFLRLWFEVSDKKTLFPKEHSIASDAIKQYKWFPYNKGGDYRKWYGNNAYLLNWENNGEEIKKFPKSNLRNKDCYLNRGITWSTVTSGQSSMRFFEYGYFFDNGGSCLYAESHLFYILALLNSAVAKHFLEISPTLNTQPGDIGRLPFAFAKNWEKQVDQLVTSCISISRQDWDSFETSWDFQAHPLIRFCQKLRETMQARLDVLGPLAEGIVPPVLLELCFEAWKAECEDRFQQLKSNEEELNRIFIDIYGLQDELTPEVEDKDVTVRRADLGRDIRSLISYAVGCMFGRYSLDRPGLQFAGGDWKEWLLSQQSTVNRQQTDSAASLQLTQAVDCRLSTVDFSPVSDNCLPITDEDYGLKDDVVNRFVDFIRTVYGEATLEENLDFIARALGNKGDTSRDVIRNYFLNDFFDDHCRTYSVTGSGKRPIYWLFDSGKANGFKALVYMHRWTADTVGNLRVEYLHRMQRVYEKEIERMQDTIDNARDSREVARATKRREKLVKQLKEARDYDAKIAHVALSRVEIDLDEGVKVNYEKVQKGPDGKSLGILAKI